MECGGIPLLSVLYLKMTTTPDIMPVQETAVFSSCYFNQFHLTNTDSQAIATIEEEIPPKTKDTLNSDVDIDITLKRYAQNLLAKRGVTGVDVDFNGQPSIMIFIEDKKYAINLPTKLDEFPVIIVEGEACFS